MNERSTSEPLVLVVEDEPRLREMLLKALPDMGFTAVGAASAEQALRAIRDQPCAIAILDLNLPGMGGMELFEKLHAEQPDMPVIILTGYGDLDAARQAIRLDVVDFLTKPCPLGELEAALDRAKRRWLERTSPATANVFESPDEDEIADDSPRTLADLEKQRILDALARHDGNRQQAADELGISVRTLYYRLKQYTEGE
jgi:DNA-binding NtrC family response regulator